MNNSIHYSNSTDTQKEYIQDVIHRDIFSQVNPEVEFILSEGCDNENAPYTWDDVENMMNPVCNNCGEENEEVCTCGAYETEDKEVYEWYLVSNDLTKCLRDIGEVVIERNSGPDIWGRCSFGQMIALDSTFWEVFQEEVKVVG